MAKSRPSGANFKGFADPNVTKIEWYRGYTTQRPLFLEDTKVSRKVHKMMANKQVTLKGIIDVYRESSNGEKLKARTIPVIEFPRSGLRHDFFSGNMSRQKMAILTDHKKMDYLLNHGTVIEKRVKKENRYGQVSSHKEHWERIWEVKGRVMIGSKDHTFTFTIIKIEKEPNAKIYDFKLRKRKKR